MNYIQKGAENKASYALSRLNEKNSLLCQISINIPQWQKQFMYIMKEALMIREFYPTQCWTREQYF